MHAIVSCYPGLPSLSSSAGLRTATRNFFVSRPGNTSKFTPLGSGFDGTKMPWSPDANAAERLRRGFVPAGHDGPPVFRKEGFDPAGQGLEGRGGSQVEDRPRTSPTATITLGNPSETGRPW